MNKNQLWLLALLAIAGCSHIQKTAMWIGGNPYETHELSMERARANYEQHCLRCHGDTGTGDGPDAQELSRALPDFTDPEYGEPRGLIAANIYYGKRDQMPAFSEVLNEKEIWEIAVYVDSLNEPVN